MKGIRVATAEDVLEVMGNVGALAIIMRPGGEPCNSTTLWSLD